MQSKYCPKSVQIFYRYYAGGVNISWLISNGVQNFGNTPSIYVLKGWQYKTAKKVPRTVILGCKKKGSHIGGYILNPENS